MTYIGLKDIESFTIINKKRNSIKGFIMGDFVPTREDAYTLLKKYNNKEGLIRHAVAVEAVMGHFAQRFNEDEEKWRVIGDRKSVV